jgi:hypothetical protein
MIWSTLPRESYSVYINGDMYGPGLTSEGKMPGVFNITWLMIAEPLEALLNFEGDPLEFVTAFEVTPAIVGTSLQRVNDKKLGEWAEELPPSKWIDLALTVDKLILAAYAPLWELLARENAKRYRELAGNVVVGDFRKSHRVL